MNRILLLNGSPKYKDSASEKYLNMVYDYLDDNYYVEEINMLKVTKTTKKIVENSDILIISTPLYVDSLPSHVLRFLIEISSLNLKNKLVYVISNCGFHEGINNIVLMDIVKNYCLRNEMQFMGGLGIGGGPVAYNKHGYTRNIHKEIKELSNKINYRLPYKNFYTHLSIPKTIYKWVANIAWYRKINSSKS